MSNWNWDSLFDSTPSTSLNSPSETGRISRPNSGDYAGPADKDSIPSGIDINAIINDYWTSVDNSYEQQPVAGGNGGSMVSSDQLQNACNPIDQQNLALAEPLHTPESGLTTLNPMAAFLDGNQSFDANAVGANEISSRVSNLGVPFCSEDITNFDHPAAMDQRNLDLNSSTNVRHIIQSPSTRREGTPQSSSMRITERTGTDGSADNIESTTVVPNGPTGEKGPETQEPAKRRGRPPKDRDTTVGKCDHHESSVGKTKRDRRQSSNSSECSKKRMKQNNSLPPSMKDPKCSKTTPKPKPPVPRKRNPRPKKVLTPEQKKAKSQTERKSRDKRMKIAVKQAVDIRNLRWTKRWNKRLRTSRNLQEMKDRLQEENDLLRKRNEYVNAELQRSEERNRALHREIMKEFFVPSP